MQPAFTIHDIICQKCGMISHASKPITNWICDFCNGSIQRKLMWKAFMAASTGKHACHGHLYRS